MVEGLTVIELFIKWDREYLNLLKWEDANLFIFLKFWLQERSIIMPYLVIFQRACIIPFFLHISHLHINTHQKFVFLLQAIRLKSEMPDWIVMGANNITQFSPSSKIPLEIVEINSIALSMCVFLHEPALD